MRYYLQPPNPSKEIVYIPYWRFKGAVFSCQGIKINHKILDTSFIAANLPFLPSSLGIRPQALKLKIVSPEAEGKFIKIQTPVKKAFEFMEKQYEKYNPLKQRAITHKAFIGETLSMIYAPVFIKERVYDAILNRPVGRPLKNAETESLSYISRPDWQVKFISTLCPDCGWDIEGEKDSLIILCKHCNTAWKASLAGLKKIDFSIIKSDENNIIYLPFWRIMVDYSEHDISTFGDFARKVNLPMVIKKDWETEPFYFWVPGFKIQPSIFLNTCKRMTLFQPKVDTNTTVPNAFAYPVTLPLTEAVESIKVQFANLAAAKKKIFSLLPSINFAASNILLVYYPFTRKGSELIQRSINISINKNALQFGRVL